MLLLCGKSCAGKDTIKRELIKLGMQAVISYTTRPPRDGEIDSVAYNFVSKEEFLEKEEQGFFAETTSYNAASGETWYYGSAVKDLTADKVIIVNPQGLEALKKIRPLNAIAFYITASQETIWDRLRERGDSIEEAARRSKADNVDFANIHKLVDFSFSNDLGLKPEALAEIILFTYNKVIRKQVADE